MKKIISFSLCIMLVFSSIGAVFASDFDDSAARIAPFNLLNTQNPDADITRSEGIRALMKLYTKTELTNTGSASVFTDVAPDSIAAPYINYAYSIGFISGVSAAEFAPDDYMTLEQFIKVAVLVLGYKEAAVAAGGYPEGYMGEAVRLGLIKNVSITDARLTVSNAVRIIDNMLDIKPLEPVYGSGDYKTSEYTLYEQLLGFNDLKALTGRVNVIEKVSLSGYPTLDDNEIMVGNKIFKCSLDDLYSYFGKNVLIRYEDKGTRPDVVSIYADGDNKEITIAADDITALSRSECVYYDTDGVRTKKLGFTTGVTVIYNGRIYSPHTLTIPQTGSITALDSSGDNVYDVLFIDEYQSLIADKVIEVNHTVYLKDNVYFNGKNGLWFDFDDTDNEYSFYNTDGTEASFADIKADDILSVWASENEDKIKVVISRNTAKGKITSKADETVTVNGTEYTIYKPERAAIMASIQLGDEAAYALNHANELVGIIGEAISNDLYAYVVGFASGQGFDAPRIRLVGAGFKEKVVETTSGTEIIKYNYTNGDITEFNFADRVSYGIAGGTKQKYAATDLIPSMFNRCTISYTLDSEGKIKSADVNSVPIFETANSAAQYLYSFNGKLNSFGGYVSKSAFYIGENTRVVCIPKNNSPSQADYGVDVTITDGSTCIIMPVDIDSETQIAAMALIYEDMNANNPKPITADDEVSVVGAVSQACTETGDIVYNLEVLKGDTIQKLYVYEDSPIAATVANLTVGDLIRYNKKSSGEVGNIQYLESLSYLGEQYFINREGSESETVYAIVETIENDRLDNLRNERVDNITVDISGRQKFFTLPREEGPVIYAYNRNTKLVSAAIPEEIQGRDRAGGGASKVFMLINSNEPVVVINIIE